MNRLKERREALGMTQPQLAKKLGKGGVDLHVSMLSRFERGRCNPTPSQLEAILSVLQAALLDVYDRSDLEYHLPAKGRAENRKRANRISGRLSDAQFLEFEWAKTVFGHVTNDEAIRCMVSDYIAQAILREAD